MYKDNTGVIYCPACSKKMSKIFMKDQNVFLDVCLDGCGGIYFDCREFKMFNQPEDDINELVKAYNGKTFAQADETKLRICPVCGSKMVKNYSSPSRDIQVDDCYICGGKFLDYQELEKIRRYDKSRRYNQASSVFEENQYKALEASVLAENSESSAGGLDRAVFDERLIDENIPVSYAAEKFKYTAASLFKGMVFGAIAGFLLNGKLPFIYQFLLKYNIQLTQEGLLYFQILLSAFIFGIIGFICGKYKFEKKYGV